MVFLGKAMSSLRLEVHLVEMDIQHSPDSLWREGVCMRCTKNAVQMKLTLTWSVPEQETTHKRQKASENIPKKKKTYLVQAQRPSMSRIAWRVPLQARSQLLGEPLLAKMQ